MQGISWLTSKVFGTPQIAPEWAAVRDRYRDYPRETLGYATVRDFCDSADNLPKLLLFNSDLKDVQRPWAVKAIVSRLKPGASLIEIGGGLSVPAAALANLGYKPSVVDPYEGYANGPTEFTEFQTANPGVQCIKSNFGPDLSEFQPESVDCVFSVSTLEHIHDQTPIFDGINKFLKPGGWSIHCIDSSIEGIYEPFSTGMVCDVLKRQRALADLPAADGEYAALVEKMRKDLDTYYMGPQGLLVWRGGRAYDEFPFQKFVSIQTCVQKG